MTLPASPSSIVVASASSSGAPAAGDGARVRGALPRGLSTNAATLTIPSATAMITILRLSVGCTTLDYVKRRRLVNLESMVSAAVLGRGFVVEGSTALRG